MRVGIDLGATKTQAITIAGDEVVRSVKRDTEGDSVIPFLITLIDDLTSGDVEFVGLSVAGTVDREGEKILATPNLRSLAGTDVKQSLEAEFGVPVAMENDGSCFTWGECLFGGGRGADSVIGLTLGTGVGGGMVLSIDSSKVLFRGPFGSSFEVGHMVIQFEGAECSCGSRGCLEAYASSQFFRRMGGLSPLEIQKRAEAGDTFSRELFREYGRYLGVGISNLVNLLDPQMVILGGGISNAWDLFIKEARNEISRCVLSPEPRQGVKIVRSELGAVASAIGAAHLDRAVMMWE